VCAYVYPESSQLLCAIKRMPCNNNKSNNDEDNWNASPSQLTTLSPSRFCIAIGGLALRLSLCEVRVPPCVPLALPHASAPKSPLSLSLSHCDPLWGDLPLLVCLIAFCNNYYGIFRCCRRRVVGLSCRKVSQMCEPCADPPLTSSALIWLLTVFVIIPHNAHIRFWVFWVCFGYHVRR